MAIGLNGEDAEVESSIGRTAAEPDNHFLIADFEIGKLEGGDLSLNFTVLDREHRFEVIKVRSEILCERERSRDRSYQTSSNNVSRTF